MKTERNLKGKTVVVAMSGGVDSAVSAALLKEQGAKVVALFMKNWQELDDQGVCQSAKDFSDVTSVCEQLDIPYYSWDFVDQYRDLVFKKFIRDYRKGLTPNPDILCNKEIKFNVFFKKAKQLGADFVATGHYCQIKKRDGQYYLAKGLDQNKDQSYFLYAIDHHCLSEVLFPVGGMMKSEVRKKAKTLGLSVSLKKDSTGVCFIGERNFKKFLSQYIPSEKGVFKLENGQGRILGEHDGAYYYTIGQRKGLGLGGPGGPWFVIGKDMNKNEVYIGEGEDHPGLYANSLTASGVHYLGQWDHFPKHCQAKIRYRQKDQDCQVKLSGSSVEVKFEKSQRAITPSQSIVFYANNLCLGGAIIDARS